MAYHSYSEAAEACSGWIANAIIENANDNEEDPKTYSTDEEVVMLYLKELARAISSRLPREVERQLDE